MKPSFAALVLLLCALAFGVGGIVCRGTDSGVLRARADSLTATIDSLNAGDVRRSRDSAAAAHRLAELARSDSASRREVERLSGVADSLKHQVIAVPDTLVPKSVALAAIEAEHAVTMRQAIRIDSLLAARDTLASQLAVSRAATRDWRAAALEGQAQVQVLLRRATRRWGCVGGVGATGGYTALGSIPPATGLGLSAGFGVTCGRLL